MADELPPGQSNQLVQMLVEHEGPPVPPEVEFKLARLGAQFKLDPSTPGARLCERCANPFDYRPRSQGEIERIHQTLFMTGPAVNHIHSVCDGCYDQITGPALRNDEVEMIGRSNSGPSNLLLKMAGIAP